MGNHQNFCYRDSGDLTDQIIENNLNQNQTISTKEAQNISTNGCEPIHPSFERSVQDSYYKKQQIGPYMKVEVSNSLVTKQCIWKEVLSKKNIQQWKDIENSLPSESSDQIQYEGKLDSLLRQIQLEDKLFFKELIQQGPPNNRLRWSSWKLFLMNEYYIKLYSICDHYEDEAVMKDVKRTLTNVKYFNSMIEGISEGQQKLQNVLLAINYVLPDLGYCQGMNFIAGFLLLISGGKEDQTFACFQKLMLDQNFLLYFMFHQELELFQLLEYIYNQELEDAFPILSQHLKKVQIENSFWITKCFLTLFLYSFKLESCLRIWDYIVTQGVFYSISILLSFIQFYQTELLNICSIDQFISWFEQFQTVPLPTQVYSDSYKYSILNKDIKEYAKIFYKQKKSSPFLRAMKKYPLLDDFIVEHVKIRII